MTESLENVLSGEESTEEVTAQAESETTGEAEQSESGSPPDNAQDALAKLRAEIEAKAQSDADAKVKAMEAELARVRAKVREQEPEKKPDLWENSEEWEKALESKLDGKIQSTRLGLSESFARDQYGEAEYNAKLDAFKGLVERTPSLIQDMLDAPNPAKFMYETASKHLMLEQVGDLDAYREKVRAEAIAEAEAKIRKEYEEKIGKALPDSLSSSRAAGAQASVGDETLEDVIGLDATHRK